LDVDDGVAVALRADAAPIQVADIDTVLHAEWALPMVHRGNLGGFVLLGSKSNNETYRPDEIDVLGFAMHQLALDLVALRVEQLEQYSSGIEHESQIREHEAAILRDQLQAAMQLLKNTDVVQTRGCHQLSGRQSMAAEGGHFRTMLQIRHAYPGAKKTQLPLIRLALSHRAIFDCL
jgi:hypothetical protein